MSSNNRVGSVGVEMFASCVARGIMCARRLRNVGMTSCWLLPQCSVVFLPQCCFVLLPRCSSRVFLRNVLLPHVRSPRLFRLPHLSFTIYHIYYLPCTVNRLPFTVSPGTLTLFTICPHTLTVYQESPPQKRFLVGCSSPFMRLAKHLTPLRAEGKQYLPGR